MSEMRNFNRITHRNCVHLVLSFIFSISLIGPASHPDKAPAAVINVQRAFAGISRHTNF